ncbi:hypothetical protein VIBRN418_18098 [Vibrio sp. N418]|uniref:FUSC family protein n=1 Tax=Vibrio sp. (strain N418) TaxID=701176 RepID=UPI00021BED1A|nr:FUSC family protein [Vibrio sp. N418]EGU31734.1 hypothetical protein VIBRN418_18098 [Vibrio sp. N418]
MLTKPSKDDWIRGVLYATAVGLPLLLQPWIESQIVVFITLGALFTLRLDPRSHVKHQAIAMIGGVALVILAGAVGTLLVGHFELAIIVLVVISYLAGQPTIEQKYFSLLGKFVAAAFVLEAVGSPVTLMTGVAFFCGGVLALILTILQARYFATQVNGWSLVDEWQQLRSGKINGPLYGMTLPITVLVSILSAQWLNAQHVSWVGLTVLFVMNVDTVTAWRKIWMRTVGTLLGVISAYIVVVFFPSALLSLTIVLSALFMPMFLRQNYMIFSWLMSMFVLLVVDLAMLQSGGDEFLIQWRFIDTLIGCGWVMVSLSLLHLGRKWWPNQPSKG